MTDLKFLGKGSAFNEKELNTSAYLIKEDNLFLIDCGATVFHEIQKKKLLDGINHVYVLLTHLHADHAGSLGTLIHYCKYSLDIDINIIYPDDNLLRLYLMYQGVFAHEYITEDQYTVM